jgi:CheY-like chemotaxis protein
MILLVDDDDTMRHVLQVFLEDRGYDVLAASNGLEGLDIYRSRGGEIKLVLTDILMPELNGIEMSMRLKDIDAHVKVIFGSGFLDGPTLQKLKNLGAVKILHKPYIPDEILGAVREVLGEPPAR